MDKVSRLSVGIPMLSVVTWRWGSVYGVEFINKMRSMLSRHLRLPHLLYCITDDPTGLDEGIIPIPIWPANGLGRCRRLRIFDEKVGNIFGERILQLDIDCVIVGDITPLVDRAEPLVMWRSVPAVRYIKNLQKLKPNAEDGIGPYNTSMLLMNAGVFPELWSDYTKDPDKVETAAKKAGLWISLYSSSATNVHPLPDRDDDQAVISLYAKPLNPPVWLEKDGVYKWGRRGFADRTKLPENARIVFFNGSLPGNRLGNKACEVPDWIKEHWR